MDQIKKTPTKTPIQQVFLLEIACHESHPLQAFLFHNGVKLTYV